MNWFKRKIEERKEKERKWVEEFERRQPPNILGQTIRFDIDESIEKDSILVTSNREGVILWRKYFESFQG